VSLAGLRRTPDLSYHISAHQQCATLVLLLSSAEVETYKGSGDVIVTNPRPVGRRRRDHGFAVLPTPVAQAFSHVR
jgi:hypothetical protein